MSSVLQVETVSWMKPVTGKNDGKKYYTIGNVKGRANTLLLQPAEHNADVMMYCEVHGFTYPIKGQCTECQNAVVELPNE